MDVHHAPAALRRLADAIEKEDKVARELYTASRQGVETQAQKDAFKAAVRETRSALRVVKDSI